MPMVTALLLMAVLFPLRPAALAGFPALAVAMCLEKIARRATPGSRLREGPRWHGDGVAIPSAEGFQTRCDDEEYSLTGHEQRLNFSPRRLSYRSCTSRREKRQQSQGSTRPSAAFGCVAEAMPDTEVAASDCLLSRSVSSGVSRWLGYCASAVAASFVCGRTSERDILSSWSLSQRGSAWLSGIAKAAFDIA